MNSHQRRARKRRQEIESRNELSPTEHRYLTQLTEKGGDVLSKHKAKLNRKESRHMNEQRRFTSGYSGDGISSGKDAQGRFRVHDIAFHMTARCWVRKGVK